MNIVNILIGCFVHGCLCQRKRSLKQIEAANKWEVKQKKLRSKGVEVRMMKECEWDRMLKHDRSVHEADTRMARILKTDTEQSLLQAIKNNSIFGFAVCSVKTNPSDIDKMIKVRQMSLINFKICF